MARLKLKHCIVAWALVGVGFVAPLSQRIKDPDFWWHIASGRLILQSHSIPRCDPFSFTAQGKGWVTHEWLSEVLFYAQYRIFGLGGVIVLRSLLIFLLALSLYLLILKRTRDELASAGLAALLTFAGCAFWGERPQLFSYLLLVTLLRLIERWRRGGSIWVVVPIFALWVNMHGAWVAGFAVLTAVLAEECVVSLRAGKSGRVGHLVFVYLAVIAALFVNPVGYQMVLYPIQYAGSNIYTRYIDDWGRPDWAMKELWPHLALLIGMPLLVLCARQKARASEWVMAGASGAASLFSVRHAPVFAVLVAPLAAVQVKAILDRFPKNRHVGREPVLLNWAALVILAFVLWLHIPVQTSQYALVQRGLFPIDAADYLWPRQVIGRGRLMVAYNWGGYAIYRLWPAYRVSIDGRADVYGQKAMDANHRLETLQGNWKADLASIDPDLVLWPKALPLSRELGGMPGWRRVYEDRASVVYVREMRPAGRGGG